MKRRFLLCATVLTLAGCGSGADEGATIDEFTAIGEIDLIALGDSTGLRYQVSGDPPPATSLTNQTTGEVTVLTALSGTVAVMPERTTTYVLRTNNRAGSDSAQVQIEVIVPPAIVSFGVEGGVPDDPLVAGDEYRVEWEVSGDYDSLMLDSTAVGEASGSRVFTASDAITHTLVVRWFGDERQLEGDAIDIRVLHAPVISSFSASYDANADGDHADAGEGSADVLRDVPFGADVQLTWELDGGAAESVFITEEGGGSVEPSATTYVREHVTNAITHELEVRNRAGAAEAQVRIEVDPASAPDGFLKIHNGRVVVMRVSETEIVNPIDDVVVTETIPQALNSGIYPEAMRDMTMAFYERFDDVFDFLIFLGGIEDTEASVYDDGAYPWYDDQFIFSDDAGLGRRDYSRRELTDYFGSPRGELRGVSFHPHLGDLRNGPSLREVMRHWGLPFIPTLARRSPCVEDTPIDANKRPGGECALGGAHEGFAGFSSNNGQLGGFDRDALMVAEQALGGNTWVDVYRAGNWSLFGAADNSIPYSPWELYAGGMMAASEVTEELWLGQRAVWYRNENGSIRTDPVTGDPLFLTIAPDAPLAAFFNFVRSWGLDLIISRMGMRQPATPDAAQAFIGAVIVVADPEHLPTDEQLDRVASDVSWFSSPAHNGDPLYNFFEATGGRGQLLLESLPQHMLRVARTIERRPTPRPPSLGAPPPLE